MTFPWHLYFMAALYTLAGVMHFIKPKMYLRIMPDYLPAHLTLVYLSGAFEIVGGIGLCFEPTHNIAIYGIIAMLISFLPLHFTMLTSKEKRMGMPKWVLVVRIFLQFALMLWAFTYLK